MKGKREEREGVRMRDRWKDGWIDHLFVYQHTNIYNICLY